MLIDCGFHCLTQWDVKDWTLSYALPLRKVEMRCEREMRVETTLLHREALPEPFSLALVPLTLRWYSCHQRKQCRKKSERACVCVCVCVCVYSLSTEWLYKLISFTGVVFTVVPMLIHCCCQLGIDLSFQSSKIKAISGRGSFALIVSFMISHFITQQFSVLYACRM